MPKWTTDRSEAHKDPELAKRMRELKVPAPVEKIIRTDILATAFNQSKLGKNPLNRVVDLECGHKTVTKNMNRAPCHECHRMILDGEDYEAFRNRRY